MRKTTTFILTVILSAALLTACSAGSNTQGQTPAGNDTSAAAVTNDNDPAANSAVNSSAQAAGSQSAASSEKVFTKDELSKYDGQNGNPAYIAVDGVVYDVTNVGAWRNGQHKGGYKAGMDLTEAFKTSPHDSSIFNGIPVVGKFAG